MNEKEILMEEYKICVESKHHHERVMWTLLSIHLGITGVLLNFWVNSQPYTSGGYGYLIMAIPLFSGIFTFLALIKHRIYWNLDIERAREIEEQLGIKRYSYFKEIYQNITGKKINTKSKNRSKIGRIDFSIWKGTSAWEISLVLVLITVFGSWYIIFKTLNTATTLELFGLKIDGHRFLLITIVVIICYGFYARVMNWLNTKQNPEHQE